jgi:hypothetical protein
MAWHTWFSKWFIVELEDRPQNFAGPTTSLTHEELEEEDVEINREAGVPDNLDSGGEVPRLDYNPDWSGENGVRLAERMRKSDGSARSILQVLKLPLLRAVWNVKPRNDATEDDKDLEIAKFCHDNLIEGKWADDTWTARLSHFLSILDFGFSVSEVVWDVNNEDQYVVKKMAPRLAKTIKKFIAWPDGRLKRVVQFAKKNGRERELKIEGRYALVMNYEREGSNYWGVSILRYMWQHFFYKTEAYRIEAVRLDRFGVGVPRAKIQKGYTIKPNERRETINILKGLRTHHQAYIIHPEEVEIGIMTPDNEHGGVSGTMDSAEHHDVMMARVALALFLTAGNQKHGNYGTTIAYADMFLYALQGLALYICETLEKEIIQPLCELNFDMSDREYPKMRASTLEDVNLKEIGALIYNLTLARALTPDDNLEQHLRRLAGMPSIEKGYSRKDRGVVGQDPLDPESVAPDVIDAEKQDATGAEVGNNEPRDPQKRGSDGTQVSKAPEKRGPIRAPNSLAGMGLERRKNIIKLATAMIDVLENMEKEDGAAA